MFHWLGQMVNPSKVGLWSSSILQRLIEVQKTMYMDFILEETTDDLITDNLNDNLVQTADGYVFTVREYLMSLTQKYGPHRDAKLFFALSRGQEMNELVFHFFTEQQVEAVNVICHLPNMFETELQVDINDFFTYKAVERAQDGRWDAVSCIYRDEHTLYAEAIVAEMAADILGWNNEEFQASQAALQEKEKILNPTHQKLVDHCMKDCNETTTIVEKPSKLVPILLAPRGTTQGTLPSTIICLTRQYSRTMRRLPEHPISPTHCHKD